MARTIGVDVGGTFTDLVFCDLETGRIETHKVATTPDDPSVGVIGGITALLQRCKIDPASIDHVLHGTTIATNAMLEHRGAKTGLITTEGFRDILHIGRHQRVENYSVIQELPWQSRPLVERRHRMTVAGRLAPPTGEEITPLDIAAVRRAAETLKAEGVEAVAICFLFSYLDPHHENAAREIVEEIMPDAFVTTSAGIVPRHREFERFTTTAMAAFVGPKIKLYVRRLEDALKAAGLNAELRIMASNGGVATPSMVSENPTLTLRSGLVAGVLGGKAAGEAAGRKRLITFDIGGTSADIGIIDDGAIARTDARSTEIAGFPLLTPMIDIHTVGAGGGSIAGVDVAGAFHVGPRSAGAQPGPAAYGQGGTEPTVTDANLVLGRLVARNFLGGETVLDDAASTRVIDELAAKLGMSRHEAAEGVLTIVNANMANAIRSRTVQKGIDPRDFALVAFGGAGALHGAEVARMLGIREVIVPPYPGITSAIGLLTTDIQYEQLRTQFQVSTAVDLDRVNGDLDAMTSALVERLDSDGVAKAQMHFERSIEMRYVGQGYELSVPLSDGVIGSAELAEAYLAFHATHAAEYGHSFEGDPIEIISLQVTGRGETDKLEAMPPYAGGTLEEALVETGTSVFRVNGALETFETSIYRRARLPAGAVVPGPAVFVQNDTTTVLPPRATATVDEAGAILITLENDQ